MPYLAVEPGLDLYYEDFGEGPPVLFTSAGNLTHKMWEGQVAALADRFRTLTWDWRGTGASAKPRAGYTCEAVAADLARLVEHTGAGAAALVAHGIGTHAAMSLAVSRPELVKALVLVSSAPWFTGERDGVAGGLSAEFIRFLQERNGLDGGRGVPYAQACAELGERWLFHHPPAAAVQQAILEQALAWPQVVINAYAASMRGIDHRDRLGRIACPTLLVHGRHDRKQRYEGAVYMAHRIPKARLLTLEDSAHMGQIEELNTFNDAVREFLLASC